MLRASYKFHFPPKQTQTEICVPYKVSQLTAHQSDKNGVIK